MAKWSVKDKLTWLIDCYAHPQKEGREPITDPAELAWKVLARFIDLEKQQFTEMFKEQWLNNENFVIRIQLTVGGRFTRFKEAIMIELPPTYNIEWCIKELILGLDKAIDDLNERYPELGIS